MLTPQKWKNHKSRLAFAKSVVKNSPAHCCPTPTHRVSEKLHLYCSLYNLWDRSAQKLEPVLRAHISSEETAT